METDFRKELDNLINLKKISIARLARKADLNHATVYNYIAGRSEMTAANLERLLNVLNSIPTPTP